MVETITFGVIADTHGVLEPEVEQAFRQRRLQKILHAGDIGGPEVPRRLLAIAPVVMIAGNIDAPPFVYHLPARAVVEAGDCKVLVVHDLGRDDGPSPEMRAWIDFEKPQVVVTGHMHRPAIHWLEGILFINPGSAGMPPRGGAPRSFGFLELAQGIPNAEIQYLRD
jgi:uncharacterized protein